MMPPEGERRTDVEEYLPQDAPDMDWRGEGGPVLVLRGVSDTSTVYAQCDTWPPSMELVAERVIHAARSRGRRWLSVSVTPEEMAADGPTPNRVRVADSPTGPRTVLLPPDEREDGVHWADFVGERVVAVLRHQTLPPDHKRYLPHVPLIEHDGGLQPIEELPEPPDLRAASYSDPRAIYGAAHLRDGADVLIWNGDGHELREGRFEVTFPVAADMSGRPTVPWGTDGFLYLHYELVDPGTYTQTLMSVRRGQPPVRHLPKHDLVMRISPGPENGVLMRLGYNNKGDIGLVYFADEQVYIRLQDDLFPDEDPDSIRAFHWAAGCGRLVALTDKRFWAVPIETVLALPRVNARTGRQVRAKSR
jgi:hypothetical protein